MYTIECIGLPGSGKSTLSGWIQRALRRHGATRDGFKESRALAAKPWLQRNAAFSVLGVFSTRAPSLICTSGGRQILRKGQCDLAVRERARKDKVQFCYFEEGIIYEAWRQAALGRWSVDKSVLRAAAGLPDLVLILRTSPEECRRRIALKDARGDLNRLLHDAPIDSSRWERAMELYKTAEAVARQVSPRFIPIDTDANEGSGKGAPESAVRAMADEISREIVGEMQQVRS